MVDNILWGGRCTCKVVEKEYVLNDNGLGEWKETVLWTETIKGEENKAALKEECEEKAKLNHKAECVCD